MPLCLYLNFMFPQTEFEKCGRVVDVYNTGKGFAFVTFDRKEDAATAIQELDGANVCGQSIKVSIYFLQMPLPLCWNVVF